MKDIIWSWPLLLVFAGGALLMMVIGNVDDGKTGDAYFIAGLVTTSVGTFLYSRIKAKREGKRYLRVKRKAS
jgi:hypothetical protein